MSIDQKNSTDLNAARRRAVQLRLAGSTLSDVRAEVGLSTPTIVAAVKAFKAGGWAAVDVKPRGRPRRNASADSELAQARDELMQAFSTAQLTQLWTTKNVADWLKTEKAMAVSQQTAANYLQHWQLLPVNLHREMSDSPSSAAATWLDGEYKDFRLSAKNHTASVLWIGLRTTPDGTSQLYAHTLRGRVLWTHLNSQPVSSDYKQFFSLLQTEFPKGLALVLPNKLLSIEVEKFCAAASDNTLHIVAPTSRSANPSENHIAAIQSNNNVASNTTKRKAVSRTAQRTSVSTSVRPTVNKQLKANHASAVSHVGTGGTTGKAMTQPLPGTRSAANDSQKRKPDIKVANPQQSSTSGLPSAQTGLTHLQRLEAESIQIMREVVAEADNPVMLYSVGKDSAVMMHLARKAFYPANPPFPLLHVDTTWKFQEMYRFRDNIVNELGFELLTHVNAEGVEKSVNPFTHGSALHTDIMKTEALKQALDKYGFDVAIGGARRDEEKSRAKERIFSFRTAQHRWEPKNQRPELWNLYNTRKQPGESIRAFPLSNWNELDIWQYIHLQNIPIVPLYFAAERPVVERDGMLIMVDDDRMPLHEGEVPMMRKVRFRTLGCYPLTGAIESEATTTPEIIQEMLLAKTSERQGRMIDNDTAASMEKKKQEGYF